MRAKNQWLFFHFKAEGGKKKKKKKKDWIAYNPKGQRRFSVSHQHGTSLVAGLKAEPTRAVLNYSQVLKTNWFQTKILKTRKKKMKEKLFWSLVLFAGG